MSPLYGIRGYCILGTTSGEELVDLKASKNLLEAICSLLGLDISLDGLRIVEPEDVSCCHETDMYYR
jgi:proteasome assembly chaperone (PAC2) family protein